MPVKRLLYTLYGLNNYRLKRFVLNLAVGLEGGEYHSRTLRLIFKDYHKVDVGLYTHGGCFIPGHVQPHTTIGRFCSIAQSIRIFNRDHPVEFKCTHAFFFNSRFGYCEKDLIQHIPLSIGNDVWIGHNTTVLPPVRTIGDGAIIGSGSVINKDVPPYAIVLGHPARIVRYRFSQETIKELLASRWWEKSIEDIQAVIHEFQQPYEKFLMLQKEKADA